MLLLQKYKNAEAIILAKGNFIKNKFNSNQKIIKFIIFIFYNFLINIKKKIKLRQNKIF